MERLCSLMRSRWNKIVLGLVAYANLKSPFEEGCVSSIISDIKAWLDKVEDKQL